MAGGASVLKSEWLDGLEGPEGLEGLAGLVC
jgi:hypothetical protein